MALMKRSNPAEQYVDSEEATQEEQMQYEQALNMALTALHDDATGPAIFQMVTGAGDIKTGIAKAIMTLLEKINVELNGNFADAAKIEVGEDLLNEILDLLIQGGKVKESDVDDQFVEDVISLVYQETAKLKEMKGDKDYSAVEEDIADAQALTPRA